MSANGGGRETREYIYIPFLFTRRHEDAEEERPQRQGELGQRPAARHAAAELAPGAARQLQPQPPRKHKRAASRPRSPPSQRWTGEPPRRRTSSQPSPVTTRGLGSELPAIGASHATYRWIRSRTCATSAMAQHSMYASRTRHPPDVCRPYSRHATASAPLGLLPAAGRCVVAAAPAAASVRACFRSLRHSFVL